MYREIIDSLLYNDSLKVIKENLYLHTIQLRDQMIVNLEQINNNSNEIIEIRQNEVKRLREINRIYKLIMIGEALIFTAFMILK